MLWMTSFVSVCFHINRYGFSFNATLNQQHSSCSQSQNDSVVDRFERPDSYGHVVFLESHWRCNALSSLWCSWTRPGKEQLWRIQYTRRNSRGSSLYVRVGAGVDECYAPNNLMYIPEIPPLRLFFGVIVCQRSRMHHESRWTMLWWSVVI